MITWRHYIPALVCFGLAFVFLSLPFLAVFLVVSGLIAIGAFYALLIRKIQKLQTQPGQKPDDIYATWKTEEPNFRNVSVFMIKKTGLMRE